MIDKDSKRHV